MMVLLIHEPNSITTTNIDIMLAPLFEELSECWNLGIVCFNTNRDEVFASRTMISWCLHGYHVFAICWWEYQTKDTRVAQYVVQTHAKKSLWKIVYAR
jgi:hypothetical protein